MTDYIFMIDGRTYRQKFRRCKGSRGTTADGKIKRCAACDEGEGHGPYWYATGDFAADLYIGIELPPEVLNHLALINSRKAELQRIRNEAAQRIQDLYKALQLAHEEENAVNALLSGRHIDAQALRRLGLEEFIFDWKPTPKRKKK